MLVHLLPAIFFQFHLADRWGMDECKLGEALNANNDKKVVCKLI